MKAKITSPLIFAALLLLIGCGDFGCGKKILSQSKSPNSVLEATIVEVDCGATTNFTAHVLLHRPTDDFRDGELLFVVKGQPTITAAWKDEHTLVIDCGCSDNDISRQVTKLGSTRIKYTFSGNVGANIG